MFKMKKFSEFNESIGGDEIVGQHMGPVFGHQIIPLSLNTTHTDVIYSEITDKIYSFDEYEDMYDQYLIVGGEPLFGFNKDNLDKLIYTLQNNK
jgi:hypothetical protein